MFRAAIVAGVLAVLLPTASFAVSKKDKEATCKIGADAQSLQGAERAKFMKNCMANRDDPRGPAAAPGPAAGAPKD